MTTPSCSFSDSLELTMGTGYWASVSKQQQAAILRPYFQRGLLLISKYSLVFPEVAALRSVVETAFLAFSFYVSSGVESPGPESFAQFFDRYVIVSLTQLAELRTAPAKGKNTVLAGSSDICHATTN